LKSTSGMRNDLLRADEFVTTEKPTKSIYRSTLVKIVYLFG
jgi:hypothetical protein